MVEKATTLPPEAIQEFKEIYKTEIGEDLIDQEAETKGVKLLRFIDLVHGLACLNTDGQKHYRPNKNKGQLRNSLKKK